MTKEELIKEIKRLRYHNVSKKSWIDREIALDLVKQLDEPQKPVVPQFVADWIEYCKNTFLSLARALMVDEIDFYNYANQKDKSRLIDFLGSVINQEIFALAWINGYELEKEKRYLVKAKGIIAGNNFLNHRIPEEIWSFSSKTESTLFKTKHSRKELEDAGFEWVFDCPGVEVKEVEG